MCFFGSFSILNGKRSFVFDFENPAANCWCFSKRMKRNKKCLIQSPQPNGAGTECTLPFIFHVELHATNILVDLSAFCFEMCMLIVVGGAVAEWIIERYFDKLSKCVLKCRLIMNVYTGSHARSIRLICKCEENETTWSDAVATIASIHNRTERGTMSSPLSTGNLCSFAWCEMLSATYGRFRNHSRSIQKPFSISI